MLVVMLSGVTAAAEPNTGSGTPQGGRASDTWCYDKALTINQFIALKRRYARECSATSDYRSWQCQAYFDAGTKLREHLSEYNYWGCRGRYDLVFRGDIDQPNDTIATP